jgi:hypothetical protein
MNNYEYAAYAYEHVPQSYIPENFAANIVRDFMFSPLGILLFILFGLSLLLDGKRHAKRRRK